jgi:hypothetical protein
MFIDGPPSAQVAPTTSVWLFDREVSTPALASKAQFRPSRRADRRRPWTSSTQERLHVVWGERPTHTLSPARLSRGVSGFDGKHRARRLKQDALGSAAEQKFADSGAVSEADDDEVGALLLCQGDDFVGGLPMPMCWMTWWGMSARSRVWSSSVSSSAWAMLGSA